MKFGEINPEEDSSSSVKRRSTSSKDLLKIPDGENAYHELLNELLRRFLRTIKDFFDSDESSTLFLLSLVCFQAPQLAKIANNVYEDNNWFNLIACFSIELTALKLSSKTENGIRGFLVIYFLVHIWVTIINSGILDDWEQCNVQ